MTASDRDQDFTEYVMSRSTVMMGTAVRLCAGDRHAAEDLVQDTLAKTYVRWDRVRHPQARDAYTRKIMVRLAQRKRLVREISTFDQVADQMPSTANDDASTVDVQLALVSQLANLSARQRSVIVLRYYLDLSEQEIAATLGCSTGSVKTHNSRALGKLRQLLVEADARPSAPQDIGKKP